MLFFMKMKTILSITHVSISILNLHYIVNEITAYFVCHWNIMNIELWQMSVKPQFFLCDYNFLIIKLNAPSDFACILGFLHELFPVASADFFSSEKCNVTLETINYR